MQDGILVLMSTYNGEPYIEDQILSIINQKVNCTVNIRIRDDGSKDETCKIVEKIIRQYPGRIELIRGNNIGYNGSFFELLNGAYGYRYYAISDQDDIWLENKLQVAVDWINKENQNIPLLYASTSFLVGDDLRPYGTTRKQQKEFSIYNTIFQNICPGHTQVMNSKLLDLIKKEIDVSEIYVYDSWIMNTAMLYGKILFNNEAYTLYRQHRNNQLGYGEGKLGRLIKSAKHLKKGDGKKYTTQTKYFLQKNKNRLVAIGAYEKLYRIVHAKNFFQRFYALMYSKMSRQSRLETIGFKLAYLLKGF